MPRPCEVRDRREEEGKQEVDVAHENTTVPIIVTKEPNTPTKCVSGVYLTTAGHRDDKIPKQPEDAINLKSASCARVLHRANLYRLAARKAKQESVTDKISSQPTPSSAVSRLSAIVSAKALAKRVRRRRRKQATDSQSRASGDSGDESSNGGGREADGGYVRRNGEIEDEELPADPSEQWSPSQRLYQKACKSLNVLPSAYFMRNLEEEEISMKHSCLGPLGAKACAISLVDNFTTKTIEFEDNNFGSEGAVHMAQMLVENFSITDLVGGKNCGIFVNSKLNPGFAQFGKLPRSHPESIEKFILSKQLGTSMLQTISENNIGSRGLRALTDVLKTHDYIRSLDLSGNGLGENDGVCIAELLKENILLKELRLSHNKLMEDGVIVIAKALVQNDTLEVLDLSWNHIRRKGAIVLCDAVKKNTGLRILRIAWNGFGIEGCKAMGRAMKVNKTLLELDLSCNRVDLTCLTELLKGIKMNTCLTCIKLGDNPISTEGAITILRTLETYPTIRINDVDIHGQCVDQEFLRVLAILRQGRLLKVQHGYVLTQEGGGSVEDKEFLNEDPMMVLMEFMRIQNLRLVDLFTSLDKDGSKSLTRKEFRDGLLSVNIPLSPAALNKLIDKLDTDGDGEVDFSELLEGRKRHKVKMHKMKQKQKKVPFHETEIGRINTKIRALLALRFAAKKEKKEEADFERRNTLAISKILSQRPSVSLQYTLGDPDPA